MGLNEAGINLNPYQGLKQKRTLGYTIKGTGRNQPKSLSGIETAVFGVSFRKYPAAGINLNPYQGLKLSEVFRRGGDRRKEGILLLTPSSPEST